jgi:thioredoxin reductase (NADPH)
VLRAASAAEGLEALRELKLRGDAVAVLLADYRMPQMNGIEFLEQAMDLFPRARRALLTAYADTDAAIQAINVVDVDHYLLKPWEPVEEKLYPVVDDMIASWRASHDPAADASPEELPVVITTDGRVLRAPSVTELASEVGLTTDPSTDFYDLVVVGGGPAGLGAAVYAASEGLRTVLIEARATGGQAGQSSRIENYLGFPDGVTGSQLAERARRQAVKFGAELITARDVVALEPTGSSRTVHLGEGRSIAAHAVVLATGVSYRTLDAPGLAQFTGRGVYYGSAMTEADECAGQDVVIVGGANSAGQAAVYFAHQARIVRLLCRGPSLVDSMSQYLVQQIAGIANIEVRTCASVVRADGDGHLEKVTVRDATTGQEETHATGHLFVFIGAVPRTDWLDGVLARDGRGFLPTGPELLVDGRRPEGWPLERDPYFLESSLPGVFVAGDVRAESVKRVASAVGEGAMAVTLVHRYLEER